MGRPKLAGMILALRPDANAASGDHALLARYVRDRHEESFRQLVARHGRTVLTACRQVLHDPADIDDAFQATFLVLMKKAKAVDASTPLGGWLYAVAHRVAVRCRSDARRRRAREIEAASRRRTTTDLPDLTWREAAAVLHDELNALPDRYRLPLLLCVVRGQTRDEAAEQLGTTVGAVRGQLQRGRTLLERRLTKRGVTLSAGLLAALIEGSWAAGGPSAALIDQTLLAAGGHAHVAVAALARGVLPVTVTSKRVILSAVLLAGLFATSVGLGGRPAAADDPPAMKAEAKKKAGPDQPPVKPTTVAGTVTGTDGKPVEGAVISVVYAKTNGAGSGGERFVGEKVATTGHDGSFRGELSKAVSQHFWVVATKPGFGVAWVEPKYPDMKVANPDKLALRVTKDQAITGRVVDTEGKAVAGLTVEAISVIEPLNGDMDRLLKGAANGGFGQDGQWEKTLTVTPELGRTTTDAGGAFELHGLGADRVVQVAVSGKGYARTSGFVLTRVGVDVEPLNRKPVGATRTTNQHPVFYPPAVAFVAGPGFVIEGAVTDRTTGKPVAGCAIMTNTGFWDNIRTTTDTAGKYRLAGVPKEGSHWVHVTAPEGAEVFSTWADVKDPDGFAAVTQDFALARGAVFAGRAIDKETKQPVPAAFQIIPTGDNPFAKRPEFETATRDMVWKGGSPDGRFRIVTVPGPSDVNINVAPTEKLNDQPLNPYRAGLKMSIDLKPDGNADVMVELDRGKTASVSVVDLDGKPASGLVSVGQSVTDHGFLVEPAVFRLPLGDSRLTVYGIGETEKRRLVVVQPEKRLAGTVRVDPGATATLTLVPVQPVRGRFIDADGKPLAGLTVVVDYDDRGVERVGEHGKFVPTATTDADGAFTIPDVIPGLWFNFGIRKGDTSYRRMPQIGSRIVTAGKPLDLGTKVLEIRE